MKLLRVGERGRERPAVLVGDSLVVDVSDRFPDFDGEFFAGDAIDHLQADDSLRHGGPDRIVDLGSERIGACLSRPTKIVGVGLNYADHAAEANVAVPDEPVFFLKASTSLSGPYDDIVLPPASAKVDWEVELGIVIRGRATYLPSPASADAHIAGYCVANDVSERSFQLERGGQWTKGKSADGFCPAGPYLVTKDEVVDVADLELHTTVNGERMQASTAGEMIFDPLHLVWYISQFMTLEPGDLICTGTPPGVGLGRNPPRYLVDGDEVVVGVSGLGEQAYRFRAFDETSGAESRREPV